MHNMNIKQLKEILNKYPEETNIQLIDIYWDTKPTAYMEDWKLNIE